MNEIRVQLKIKIDCINFVHFAEAAETPVDAADVDLGQKQNQLLIQKNDIITAVLAVITYTVYFFRYMFITYTIGLF